MPIPLIRQLPEIELSADESAMIQGELGESAQLAMRILIRVAPLYGARCLIPVTRAHIDGCIFEGEAGLDFAERLAAGGGRVRVPTSMNVISLDRARWKELGQQRDYAEKARRLAEAYLAMGAIPTFTCAPYQTSSAPVLGEQIAWSESNAVAYANSVLGARTNRYGDYLDISCALTGLAPASGLHLSENRLGTHRFVIDRVPPGLEERTDFYAVLGYLLGRLCPDGIPVVEGLTRRPDDDQLKAMCAAAATSGAIALMHLVGITPEAPTAVHAFGGRKPKTMIRVGLDLLRDVRAELTTARSDQVDVVAFGSPHCSVAECREIAGYAAGLRARDGVQVFVTTSSAVRSIAGELGILAELERFGATVTADTCVAVAPLVRPGARVLMTNSAKYAHYGPGLIGVDSVFGSTRDCVLSAVTGRVIVDEGPWR